uniref:Protein arginine methyltransferase NDUFAF7 n=1 Tax=Glossina brevipalpis TaxID=37001 RepID=A0A1A9WU50_9MUSC
MLESKFKYILRLGARKFSYKSVKRPDFSQEIKIKTKTIVEEEAKKTIDITKQLKAKILATGPITVADYMREVLTHPHGGYYMHKDVFGREGDFITSPEICQIFAELIGIWFLTEWYKLGTLQFQLIELGPGRGTLIRDLLRVLTHFKVNPQFSIHLVEISPYLSSLQAERICHNSTSVDDNTSRFYRKGETASGVKVFWYKHYEDVPRNFSLVIAHEFFDALPIHKLQFDKNLWKEVLIDIISDITDKSDFRFVLSKEQTPVSKIYRPLENEKRLCLEYSLEGDCLISTIAKRLQADGGIGLIIDYGHFGDKTDTFRGFRKHALHDPLINPGSADLTADVDFRRLKHTAEKNNEVITFGPIKQSSFLQQMQGEIRLERLLKNALPENQNLLKSGYEMLVDPKQMGSRYNFFSMFPAVLKEHLNKFPVNGFHSSQ